ncbi:MAG: DegV family protein [Clostridiales bacterium]|nr:DegV family protein [Clostridiales bacterium]
MYRTAIVTDTNSGISPQQAEAMGISLIPMPFLVDGKLCLEGRDCTPEEFFQQLRAGADVSTSQPAPEEILELWETLLKDHDAVLHFPMSSGLSGSCQTAKALAREYAGRVFVVDDHRISVTLLQSIRNAQILLEQGKTAEEVRDILEGESLESSIYIAVNTLEYLKKSGRVTAAGAAMASVLNIKPVLQIQGDKLDAFKKVRGMRQAETAMLKAMKNDLETRFAGEKPALFAVYSGDKAPGDQWLEQVRAYFPDWQVEQGVLPLSICCHVGEGALAIACAKKR